jgi:hypothetical protein
MDIEDEAALADEYVLSVPEAEALYAKCGTSDAFEVLARAVNNEEA